VDDERVRQAAGLLLVLFTGPAGLGLQAVSDMLGVPLGVLRLLSLVEELRLE